MGDVLVFLVFLLLIFLFVISFFLFASRMISRQNSSTNHHAAIETKLDKILELLEEDRVKK